MKGFVLHITSGALSALTVFAQLQPPSCYTTTTVVFGHPQSILSSLSLVSNITNISTASTTSTPISSSRSASSIVSPTGTSAGPAVKGLFRITVNIPGSGKLRMRAIEYVSFSGNAGILVTDPTQATLFELINGYLETSIGLYVGASTNEGYIRLQTSSIPPLVAQGWTANSDGNVTLGGSANFCYTPDGALYVIFDQQNAFACTAVQFTAATVATTPSSSVVPLQSAAQISMIGVTALSSLASIVSTTTTLGSTLLVSGSSQALMSSQSLSTQTSASSPLTSISSQVPIITSSSIVLSRSSTDSGTVSSSISLVFGGSRPGSPAPISSTTSSSLPAVVSNPTNVVGPGQLSTQITAIFSLPFSVSSIDLESFSIVTFATSALSISPTASSSSWTSNSSLAPRSSPLSPTVSSTSGISTPTISVSAGNRTFSTSGSSNNYVLTTIFANSISTSLTTSSHSSTSSLPAIPYPYQRNNGKRGLAYTNITLTQLYSLQGQFSQVSWAYDYYSLPNASNNFGPVNPALTFIPTLYNNANSLTSIWSANVQYSIQNYGTDAIFSFNEPDACDSGKSACMSIAASVAAYRSYLQPFAGQVLLGAPSVTNGGPPASLTYLSYFLGNCTGCTVDFINLHWYSSPYAFSYLTSYVQQAYAVGGRRPIYLTEFGMDNVYYSEADVATFLKNATTWLDAQSYVMRYAWFGAFPQSGPAYQQGFGYLVNASGNALSNEGVIFNNYTGGYVPCPISSGC